MYYISPLVLGELTTRIGRLSRHYGDEVDVESTRTFLVVPNSVPLLPVGVRAFHVLRIGKAETPNLEPAVATTRVGSVVRSETMGVSRDSRHPGIFQLCLGGVASVLRDTVAVLEHHPSEVHPTIGMVLDAELVDVEQIRELKPPQTRQLGSLSPEIPLETIFVIPTKEVDVCTLAGVADGHQNLVGGTDFLLKLERPLGVFIKLRQSVEVDEVADDNDGIRLPPLCESQQSVHCLLVVVWCMNVRDEQHPLVLRFGNHFLLLTNHSVMARY